jgi:gluconokinase
MLVKGDDRIFVAACGAIIRRLSHLNTNWSGEAAMGERVSLAVVVMGGQMMAVKLGCRYVEGDRLHPAANIEKMEEGIPLTDEDRWPWLDLIGEELSAAVRADHDIIVTCSALKKIYRERLREAADRRLKFVFLTGDPKVLENRMGKRTGHFMPTSLLQSQLATLESPQGEPGVVTVDIDASLDVIVAQALAELSKN